MLYYTYIQTYFLSLGRLLRIQNNVQVCICIFFFAFMLSVVVGCLRQFHCVPWGGLELLVLLPQPQCWVTGMHLVNFCFSCNVVLHNH